jgi:regulator of replication initiation timing
MVQGLSRRAEAPPPLALTVAPSEFLDNLVEEYEKLASENRNLREKLGRERIEKDDLLQAIEEQSKQHATVVSDLRKGVGISKILLFL